MQMDLLNRSLKWSLAAALLVALVPTGAVAASEGASAGAAAVKLPVSVKVAACRSSAWYSAREVRFRTRMWRLMPGDAMKLEVKVEIQRKLKESRRYRKLKLNALSSPTQSKDATATIYQRDVTLRNVETSANYRARTTFRWRDSVTGRTRHKRVVTSKVCKQKTALPKLSISSATVDRTPLVDAVAGGPINFAYTINVANRGRSEAVDVPVAVRVDGRQAAVATIDSIGPRQSAAVVIRAAACRGAAVAAIDPAATLRRLGGAMRRGVAVAGC